VSRKVEVVGTFYPFFLLIGPGVGGFLYKSTGRIYFKTEERILAQFQAKIYFHWPFRGTGGRHFNIFAPDIQTRRRQIASGVDFISNVLF
jgi:hypothetical protein